MAWASLGFGLLSTAVLLVVVRWVLHNPDADAVEFGFIVLAGLLGAVIPGVIAVALGRLSIRRAKDGRWTALVGAVFGSPAIVLLILAVAMFSPGGIWSVVALLIVGFVALVFWLLRYWRKRRRMEEEHRVS
jgi:MFS family permease